MRICFLADAPSVLVQRWLTYAVGRGHEVHVLTLSPSARPLPGVTEHVIAAPLGLLPRTVRYLVGVPQVRSTLADLQPDLVHAHYAWGHGVWAALGGRRPVVVSLWGSDVMVSARASAASRWLMRFILGGADRVCATGPALARAGARYTERPIAITPFGVDVELFRPDAEQTLERDPQVSKDRPLRVGMVKRLDDNSGAGVLIEALARVRAQGVDVVAELVGAVADRRWTSLVRELGLQPWVRFTGVLPPDQVASHVRSWDIAVQPSRYTEGFGVSVLEASASGVAVIASEVGGLADVVVDGVTGLLVPPGDPTALAAALDELAGDPQRRRRLGVAGRELVTSHYSIEHAEALMDQVYDEATGTHLSRGRADQPPAIEHDRLGAVSVLYGARQVPDILVELARGGAHVVVVDNSGDLDPTAALPPNVRVVRPGRNLGYSGGVNAAVAALVPELDALLLVNPDIAGPAAVLVELAAAVAARPQPTLAAPTDGAGRFGRLPRAPFWLVFVHYGMRSGWHPRVRGPRDAFLSGAVLALNAQALRVLAPHGVLLEPSLFFMDDVELGDRALALGVDYRELPAGHGLVHEGGTSMRRRPAVRIYFSRVSKVRYWQRRSPWRGAALRAFFLAETAVGEALARRHDGEGGDGSAADGFRWARRWLRTGDADIDEIVLGNVPREARPGHAAG